MTRPITLFTGQWADLRRPAQAAVSIVLGGALLLSGCSVPGSDAGTGSDGQPGSSDTSARPAATGPLAKFYGQRLRWRGCGDDFECARLTVPLDYTAPKGRTISLAVIRLPAADDDPRGSLLVNPGGPGASGVDYARAAEGIVSADVRDRYDVVGFDPRGVARSAPVDCLSDRGLDELLAADGSPDSAEEEQALQRVSAALAAGCAARRPAVARHMGTREAARDMDVLRAVLGDKRLTYLGKSYGTYLGTTYAELFPRKVGRLVLDGQLDPAASGQQIAAGQAAGFQRAFRAFLADCVGRSSCPVPGTVDEAQSQVSGLLDEVDAEPLRGEPGRPVTQALMVLGIAAALYDETSWPILRQALSEAQDGNGTTFLLLADFYSDRGPDGKYQTNAFEALYAVNCLDRPEEKDLGAYRDAAADIAAASPVFGPYIAWGALPCATWPYPPQGTPHAVVARGARPILVVGTTRDPATPYVWSQAAAKALESGRLLTYVGDGHTAYRRGSSCIDDAVDRYLLDGKLPPAGTRCR